MKNIFFKKSYEFGLKDISNLVELVRFHALHQGEKLAFCFLKDNGQEEPLSYSDLHQNAIRISNKLKESGVAAGDRAILLYPSGLDFISAFFGCLYAGIVAVPAYPPQTLRHQEQKLTAIISDCQPKVILSLADNEPIVADFIKRLNLSTSFIHTDAIEPRDFSFWSLPKNISSSSLAFLQYTSGSTGNPKGVMISHENLLHNNRQLELAFGGTADTVYVSWLPLFHDMGLISGVLEALYLGVPHYFMTPSAFLQSPVRWLQAISDYKATTSGGPNFAYQLCAQRITEEQKKQLDLSSWRMAFNGAEPISPETLDEFSHAFACCGFRKEALYPCYGLAESTLIVTGGEQFEAPTIKAVDVDKLARDEVATDTDNEKVSLVGVGHTWLEQKLSIVNPHSKASCVDGQVGEVWLEGKNVAQGYWNNKAATEITFKAYTQEGHGPYLRTGDLGFLLDGELFITGRLKDLIVIRGQNIYPQDIEASVHACHPALRYSGCAAFSVSIGSEEQVVVVQEVERTAIKALNVDEVMAHIKQAVSISHGLPLAGIVLIKPHHLLRTTSGKVQRQACKQAFLHNKFNSIASWTVLQSESTYLQADGRDAILLKLKQVSADEQLTVISQYLRHIVAEAVRLPVDQVTVSQALNTLGLSSLRAVDITSQVEKDLNILLPLEKLLSDDPIHMLAEYLREGLSNPDMASVSQMPSLVRAEDNHTPFALTDIQQAYWLGRESHFVLGNNATHVYFEFDFNELNIKALSDALNKVIQRHPMLRAVMTEDGQQQILAETPDYKIAIDNLKDLSQGDRQKHLASIRKVLSHQKLPLSQWPLFDVKASEIDGEIIRLHISIDMLIADGWSIHVWFREWFERYNKPANDFPALTLNFKDYVHSQDDFKEKQTYQSAKAYWMSRLDQLSPPPALPFAMSPASLEKPFYTRRQYKVSADKWQKIKTLCQQFGVTPSSFMLTAYAEVLAFWSDVQAFSINVTLFNRLPIHSQINEILGDFTSLNFLSINHASELPFNERIRCLQKQLLQDLTHRHFTGVEVLRAMQAEWVGNMPFVVFTSFIDIAPDGEEFLANVPAKNVFALSQTSQSAMDNVVWEQDGGLTISWDCAEDLFAEGVLDEMFAAYQGLIESLVDDEQGWQQSGFLCQLPQSQYLRRLDVNNTYTAEPQALLHTEFARQAHRVPDNTAVVSAGLQITYQQLGQAVISLCQKLNTLGGENENLIAVVMEKGWEQIAGVLAVHFSNAAYVPIDPCWPEARRNEIIAQTKVKLVLTTEPVQQRIQWPADLVYCLVKEEQLYGNDGSLSFPRCRQKPQDLAYILFTSGTTGKPKGVMVHHQGAVNTLQAINEKYQVTEKDRAIALSSLTFDLSVYDTFGLLSVGGAIVMPDSSHLREPLEWWKLVHKYKVTVWSSVPAFVQMAIDYLEQHAAPIPRPLQKIMMSGDWIPVSLPDRIRALSENIQVISLAGPTETSIWSITYPIGEVDKTWNSIPYGKPLANQGFHVLRDDLSPCPDWVSGELYISGLGISKGYWQDEDKTQAHYIINPNNGVKYFKSGDMGRYLPDGNIEFLGRRDNQVKVNGYRIELGEVESALLESPAIKQAVVRLAADKKRLEAFLIPLPHSDKQAINVDALNHLLAEKLPCYMVPSRYQVLDALPLSANGKVNRQALPDYVEGVEKRKIRYPETPLQHQLLMLWQDVLACDEISIDDDFFQLGGNSLSAAQLINTIAARIGVRLPTSFLFSAKTIQSFATAIELQKDNLDDIKLNSCRAKQCEQSSLVRIIDEPVDIKPGFADKVNLDAAAIAYFPEWLLEQNPNGEVDEYIQSLRGKPVLHRQWNTPWGQVGLILLPIWGSQLYSDKSKTQQLLLEGLRKAKALGATSVSLTGVIPSATNYGIDIQQLADEHNLPSVTTGHGTTTSAVVLTIEEALSQAGRGLKNETVGFLGLGSIGLTSLELMLSILEHPKKIILCDLYSRREHLKEIKALLVNKHGYQGGIEIIESDGEVPESFYAASLIVGATNVPDVLSIDLLQSGTIIVDDSAPHCFNASLALQRMQREKDILVTEGGMLRSQEVLPQFIYMPPVFDGSNVLNFYIEDELMGCTLSSLLSTQTAFPSTLGTVKVDDARQHYQGLVDNGLKASRLHCGAYILNRELLRNFKKKFGK